MDKKSLSYMLVFILLFMGTHAHASAPEWKVDPAHSGIYFRITHIYSSVNGFFTDWPALVR